MAKILKVETLFYLLILILLYGMQYQRIGGAYIDTDNYMHALRTLDFMEHPSMFERLFMQTDYPFGEASHWTRLMDILMALCAMPFLPWMSTKEAVFSGGFLLVPLCAVGVLFFLQKIGYEWFNARSRLLIYCLLFVQSQFTMIFKINRPDHHAVIIFLFTSLLWLLSEYVKHRNFRSLQWAALICAIALWLAVEGFFMYVCTLTFLYLASLLFEYSYRDIVKFTVLYAGFCVLFWLINPPVQGYFYPDNGRLSFLYCTLALYIAGAFYGAGWLQNKFVRLCVLGAAALFGFVFLRQQGYLLSPLPVEITEAFTSRISEMESGANIYYLAYPLLAVMMLPYMYFKLCRREQALLLTCFLLPYMVLSMLAMRFSGYTILCAIIILAFGLTNLRFGWFKFSLLVLCLCLVEFVSFTMYSLYRYDLTKPVEKTVFADIVFLKYHKFPQGSVVSDVFLTPYILWYAERPTVASPYHRNVEGILDNHAILMNPDMKKVVELIKKHQVGTIMLPLEIDKNYYKEPQKNCDKLYAKMLSCRDYPEWIKENDKARRWNYVVLEIIKEKLPVD